MQECINSWLSRQLSLTMARDCVAENLRHNKALGQAWQQIEEQPKTLRRM